MYFEKQVIQKIKIAQVKVVLPVRYEDEDIPYDFPLRRGDLWGATIDIETGCIAEWPIGESGELYMKVIDKGSYYLTDSHGNTIASIEEDYVPNNLIPGEYGDYVHLKKRIRHNYKLVACSVFS